MSPAACLEKLDGGLDVRLTVPALLRGLPEARVVPRSIEKLLVLGVGPPELPDLAIRVGLVLEGAPGGQATGRRSIGDACRDG